MKKILLLPIDERPCSCLFPQMPARALNEVMVPPVYADEPMKNQNGHIAAEACWFPWERTFGLGVDVRSEGKAVIRERM